MGQGHPTNRFQGSFKDFCRFLRTEKTIFLHRRPKVCSPAIATFANAPTLSWPACSANCRVCPTRKGGSCLLGKNRRTTAYYHRVRHRRAAPAGIFANTYALNTRPKWEMEALSLHESVPAITCKFHCPRKWRTLRNFAALRLYRFRRGLGPVFGKSRRRTGFYKRSYSKFGQLTYEMLRAVRLVVDTGMHSMGWSRKRGSIFISTPARASTTSLLK